MSTRGDVRCQCGAVHYDLLRGESWTCGFCGMEHVELTREEGRQFLAALAGEPLTDSGVYTAPDGLVYLIEMQDLLLACDLDHEHDLNCYEQAETT